MRVIYLKNALSGTLESDKPSMEVYLNNSGHVVKIGDAIRVVQPRIMYYGIIVFDEKKYIIRNWRKKNLIHEMLLMYSLMHKMSWDNTVNLCDWAEVNEDEFMAENGIDIRYLLECV